MHQAILNKRMQSSRSFPDISILIQSRGYGALFIELKKENTAIYLKRGSRKGELVANEHIAEQALMLKELNKLGYFARFGVGFDACKKIIDWYLNPNMLKSEPMELF